MSLEALITEIATSHPVATRAQRVTGITHRVGDAKNTAEAAADSAANANAEASRANTAVLEAAQTAQQAGEDARQAGADVLDTIRRIEDGSLKTYLDLTDYINQGKLAGQITGIYIANLAVDSAKIADAAINSAKIANLAVNSQHVNELTASKITSGDITASLVNITGRLEAGGGGVRLDGMGLGLAPLANTGSAPADQAGRKVTNQGASKWTALFPFEGGGVRGMGIRSDGASGGENGRVELVSTAFGDSTHNTTGRLRLDAAAGNGALLVQADTTVQGSMGVSGAFSANSIGTPGALRPGSISSAGRIYTDENVYAAGRIYTDENVYAAGVIGPNSQSGAYRSQFRVPVQSISAGVVRSIPHSFGAIPRLMVVELDVGVWTSSPVSFPAGFTWWANASELVFRNGSGQTVTFRAEVCQLLHT